MSAAMPRRHRPNRVKLQGMVLASILGCASSIPDIYVFCLAILPLILVLSIRSLSGLGPIRRWIAIGMHCAVMPRDCTRLRERSASATDNPGHHFLFLTVRASVPRTQQQAGFDFIKSVDEYIQSPAWMFRRDNDRIGVIAFDGERGRAASHECARNQDDRRAGPAGPNGHSARDGHGHGPVHRRCRPAHRVYWTDRNENVGQALEEADQLKAAGRRKVDVSRCVTASTTR